MKTVIGNNNIVLVENLDGTFNDEMVLDPHTTLITGSDKANVFNTQEELRTFVASIDAAKFPPLPEVGQQCELNKIYAYGVNKAKCVQAHIRMNFTPESTPALFTVITTVVGYPVWKQPIGATDAYSKGDRVHFPLISDPVYESLIAANVWSPTGYPTGWKKI